MPSWQCFSSPLRQTYVAKRYILSALNHIIARSKSKWDDAILGKRTLRRLSNLAPALVIYVLIPVALEGLDLAIALIRGALQVYMLVTLMLVLDSLLNAFETMYRSFQAAREIPIKGFIQVLKLVLYFVTGILVISILLDKTPVYLLSGIGAFTAVVMLIIPGFDPGFRGRYSTGRQQDGCGG